jgi:glutaredoxin 2
MALGFLDLPYESIVLPYDDEKTPVDLMGVKMLPIFEFSDKSVSNESLDIIKALDKENSLKNDLLTESNLSEIDSILSKIGSDVHSLCMPYWMWTPEFNEQSRQYFQKKKEVKRGPFNKLIHKKEQFITSLNSTLDELESTLDPFYNSKTMTIQDIMIASHLWGMYIFPEYKFSEKIDAYLQSVSRHCKFNYHEDFWRD